MQVLPRDIVGEKCVGGHGQQAEKQMYMAVLPACVLCGSCMFGVYKARRESSRTGAAGCSCGISRNQTQVSECKHLYLLNRVTEPTLLFLEDIQESQNPEEGFHRPENAKWNFRKSEAEPRPTAARRRACAAASETLQAQFSFWVSSYLKTQSGVSGSPEGSPGRAAIRNGARARARARTRPSHPEPEVGAIAAWGLAWPGRRQRRPSWLPAERQCEGKKL
ncbi:uncharacterized protein LOC127697741 isoform X2 [Apodemus sylvaticus]|uniref:uncharacterized protein LOC127697741 isoform X2 n=1 Tax=Apodemus sylvaticus TaxID=10129 RepID=UPI002242E9A8|nr:uncharacterized protein LOC127697741 isoform X2 [Apodemus sylvaticus]